MCGGPSTALIAARLAPLARQADGSAALIFSPQPPADAPRSNWIPTAPGRAWFGAFRLEGPLQPGFDGGWTLPEIRAL